MKKLDFAVLSEKELAEIKGGLDAPDLMCLCPFPKDR